MFSIKGCYDIEDIVRLKEEYFSNEGISHFKMCAEVLGNAKQQALEDDNRIKNETDLEKARSLSQSPINFITTILGNVQQETNWDILNPEKEDALQYFLSYINHMHDILEYNPEYIKDESSMKEMISASSPHKLSSQIVEKLQFAEQDGDALKKELEKNLKGFMVWAAQDHGFMYYIQPILIDPLNSSTIKLFYVLINIQSDKYNQYVCCVYEMLFERSKLNLENALVELDKLYKGLDRWLKENKKEITP